MAEFLTTHGTTARIEQVIAKADAYIGLLTPYLEWSRLLYERLLEADRRGVPTVFVYGKKALASDQMERLVRLDNLTLYYCPNLHAKCYFNEHELIISSLNLLEFFGAQQPGNERRRWQGRIRVPRRPGRGAIHSRARHARTWRGHGVRPARERGPDPRRRSVHSVCDTDPVQPARSLLSPLLRRVGRVPELGVCRDDVSSVWDADAEHAPPSAVL